MHSDRDPRSPVLRDVFSGRSDAVPQVRELKPLEAWECRKARRNGQLLINGRPVEGKIGTTVSHTMFLSGSLDDDSNCEVGAVTLQDGKVLGGMAS